MQKYSFDFNSFKLEMEEMARAAFKYYVEKHDDIYAFSLYSDEGAMTVCPGGNTVSFLDENGADDYEYYKFSPEEWLYQGDGADELVGKLCNKLRDVLDEYEDDDSWFEWFQENLYQSCFGVLLKLKNGDFFRKTAGRDSFLIFAVTEFEMAPEKLKSMAQALNDNSYAPEYLDWVESWS